MTEPFIEGELFAGKYRIEEILGQGGMGVVLAARHLALDEPVAIKVLLPAMMELSGMVQRFTREARASSKIKNDHIVRVTDVDMLPSGVPYMVMERLDGMDLSLLCKRVGPLPIADAVRYLLETCSAISEAHAMGIIHRDLKPANLFLARRPDGTSSIKVLDFGISKLMHAVGEQTVTVAGMMLGSPHYMSPEQIAADRDLDGRTDIWSLGVILYKLLTGKVPFPSENVTQLCALVLQAAPRRPSELRQDLPPILEAIILRCLEKDRSRRFSTAGELAAALRSFSDPTITAFTPSSSNTEPIVPLMTPPARPTVPSQATNESVPGATAVTFQQSWERSPARTVALACTLGLVGLGGAALFWFGDGPRPIVSPGMSSAIPTVASAASAAPPVAPSVLAIGSASAPPALVTTQVEGVPVATVRAKTARNSGAAKVKPIDVGF